MCFKDIVPKPYQEFQDVFIKESFDELPNQKQWDHAIKLILDAHNFSTKVYPLAPVEQKQLDKFLNKNLKSQHMSFEVTHGIPGPLHQEEGWEPTPGPRLPKA